MIAGTAKLLCVVVVAMVALMADADARSRRGRSQAGVYAAHGAPVYVGPRRIKARYVVVPLMLGGGGGSGPAMCYPLGRGWYCIPL